MFCSKCGNQIAENNRFCSKCGNPITNNFNNTSNVTNTSFSNTTINQSPVLTPINNVVSPKKKTNLVNKILVIIIVLVGLVSLFAIGKIILNKTQSRVVMIYMVGSNLESRSGLATRDLSDLDYKKLKANNTKVILIAGGTTAWKNNYIDVNETSIYYLGPNGFEKVDARPINNMGSSDNLAYFLNYVYKNYKASKYNFIYWNHGGGVDGSEYDDITHDHLMLTEMAKAFENSSFKDKKLETISFRTCLNGTIEVANIYKKYAKYLVASEETTIGSQLDSAIKFLNNVKASDTPVQYGKKQIDAYKSVVTNTCNYMSPSSNEENYCVNSTYSITDLSKIDDLNEKLDDFSKDLNNKLNSNYSAFSKLRANMKQYGSDELSFDMIDLYNFAELYDNYSIKGKAVREAIEKTVVYNWTNNNFSHGLSIYFPYYDDAFLNNYSSMSTASNYTSFINNFYKMKSGMRISSYNSFSSNNTMVSKKDKKEADVEVELTEEQINNMSKAGYLVFVDTKDGYYKIIYSGTDVKVDGNKLKASVRDRLLRITDSEYDDDSSWILASEEEVGDDYVELKTNIYLSNTTAIFFDKTYTATAIIRIDSEHPNGYIKAIYTDLEGDNNSENLSVFSPAGINIEDYNFASVLNAGYKLLEDGKYNQNWRETGNHVIEGKVYRTNNFKFIKEDFSDKYDYYLVFRVLDIANNEYDSNPIKLN